MRIVNVLLVIVFSVFVALKSDASNYPVPINTAISFPEAHRVTQNTVRIPFKMTDNLITVVASINGKEGNFIIDTGSYTLVLNEAHYKTVSKSYKKTYSVHNEISDVRELNVKSMTFDDFEIDASQADLIDLEPMEISKKKSIYGIIGYSVLKDYEVYIDFLLKQVTLYKMKKNGDRIDDYLFLDRIQDSLDFKRVGHAIVLNTKMNGKRLKLVLDTGAEFNQLSKNVPEQILQNFYPIRRVELLGMDMKGKEVIAGKFHRLKFTDKTYCAGMPTVISDMEYARESFGTRVDGVLGYWFIANRRIIINYKKKKVYFAHWPVGY